MHVISDVRINNSKENDVIKTLNYDKKSTDEMQNVIKI